MIRQILRFAVLLLLACVVAVAGGPGFRSKRSFTEHFAKHGAEFGSISKTEYLELAQQLRDAPVGGPILEKRSANGMFSRFDQQKGCFGAFNSDGTIRTFFKPNQGERYFRRQAEMRGEE